MKEKERKYTVGTPYRNDGSRRLETIRILRQRRKTVAVNHYYSPVFFRSCETMWLSKIFAKVYEHVFRLASNSPSIWLQLHSMWKQSKLGLEVWFPKENTCVAWTWTWAQSSRILIKKRVLGKKPSTIAHVWTCVLWEGDLGSNANYPVILDYSQSSTTIVSLPRHLSNGRQGYPPGFTHGWPCLLCTLLCTCTFANEQNRVW